MVGIGSWVRDGASIGANSLIGEGFVVACDIRDGVTAYGNPARIKLSQKRTEVR